MHHWPLLPTMPVPMMTMGPRAPQSTMKMAMTLLVTLSLWSARRLKVHRLHTFLEAKGAQRSPWQPHISLDHPKSQKALLGPFTHHHRSPLQLDRLPSSGLQVKHTLSCLSTFSWRQLFVYRLPHWPFSHQFVWGRPSSHSSEIIPNSTTSTWQPIRLCGIAS